MTKETVVIVTGDMSAATLQALREASRGHTVYVGMGFDRLNSMSHGQREVLEEIHGGDVIEFPDELLAQLFEPDLQEKDDIFLLHDSLMPPNMDMLEAFLRGRDSRNLVLRMETPLDLKVVETPLEPKKTRWEELREQPRGPRRGRGPQVKVLKRAKG